MEKKRIHAFFADAVPAHGRVGRVAAGRVGPALFQTVAYSVAALGDEVFPVWHELRERRPALLRPDGHRLHGDGGDRLRSSNGLIPSASRGGGRETGRHTHQRGLHQREGEDDRGRGCRRYHTIAAVVYDKK